MSFLKSLFGFSGGKSSRTNGGVVKEADHNGFHIAAAPYQEQGQYQVAGVISKEVGGQKREHRFVRADRFATREEAADFAIHKGRQIIDQQGDKVFG